MAGPGSCWVAFSSFYLPDFASVSIPILCDFPPHFSRASFCWKHAGLARAASPLQV